VVELLIECGADITATAGRTEFNIFHTVACEGATDAIKVKILMELAIAVPKCLYCTRPPTVATEAAS